MDHRLDVADRQELVCRGHAEHGVHRLRPIDAAGGEVPVPQAAAAAAERRVDAVADAGAIGFSGHGPARLGEIREGDDAHHGRRQQQQEAGAPGGGAPFGQRAVHGLQEGDLAEGRLEIANGNQGLDAVGQDEAHRAGLVGENRQRQPRAEARGQRAARQGGGRQTGDDLPVLIGDDEAAAVGENPALRRVEQHGGGRAGSGVAHGGVQIFHRQPPDHVEFGQRVRQDAGVALGGDLGGDAEQGDQEQDDHRRDSAAQPGFHVFCAGERAQLWVGVHASLGSRVAGQCRLGFGKGQVEGRKE